MKVFILAMLVATASAAEVTTPEVCMDDVNLNCWSRPDSDCFGIYEGWSRTHCPLRCGYCGTPPCEDALNYCSQFEASTCADANYAVWARQNCRKYCKLCHEITPFPINEIITTPQALTPSITEPTTTTPAWTTPITVSNDHHWASLPKDGDVVYACVGEDVTFPWSFTVTQGEEVTSMEWLFDGSSYEMMAILSHGMFVRLPAFSDRVQQTANGGIVLRHVTAGDSGNYTLEVNLLGSSVVRKHTLTLQVISGPPTTDGQLHVHQQPDAVLDSASQQWSLVLSCGRFTFLGQPAFPVEWLTPSGQVMTSSAYNDGFFDLHLASVEGGTYTCRVPKQHPAVACFHGNHSAFGKASVWVDKMEARVTLMEAEVRVLRRCGCGHT